MKASSSKIAQTNSKSGHKNITYVDRIKAYEVRIVRDGKIFHALTNSLEEAIEIRDKVYNFFEESKRLPSKEEMNITRRSNRSMKVEKTYEKVSRTCESCGRQLKCQIYKSGRKIAEAFEARGNICGYCEMSKDDFISSDDDRYMKRNKSGERYISLLEHKNGKVSYVVKIFINNHNVTKSFKTMTEAVEFRDEMLEFIETYNRMPTEEEKFAEFKIQTCGRKKLATSESLKDDDTKYISYVETKNRYHVKLSRQNRTFQFYCKTLEDAINVRRLVLEMYETNGILPTSTEFRSRVSALSQTSSLDSISFLNAGNAQKSWS